MPQHPQASLPADLPPLPLISSPGNERKSAGTLKLHISQSPPLFSSSTQFMWILLALIHLPEVTQAHGKVHAGKGNLSHPLQVGGEIWSSSYNYHTAQGV
ncbi:hypothetical protein Pmani_014187 [Petrolisthes manimaculis]|uniref:Uncharacterized protein n=1 Tax=Petrolisthes manimaculis TaxID=1843537 RepID=A0AAE1PWV3_9EUCA|nr:hypothetical protein Pmani_014187 [Petrolisthes manimaculis]